MEPEADSKHLCLKRMFFLSSSDGPVSEISSHFQCGKAQCLENMVFFILFFCMGQGKFTLLRRSRGLSWVGGILGFVDQGITFLNSGKLLYLKANEA